MPTVCFEVPDDLLVALKVSPAETAAVVLLAAAVKLYEVGRLSAGPLERDPSGHPACVVRFGHERRQ